MEGLEIFASCRVMQISESADSVKIESNYMQRNTWVVTLQDTAKIRSTGLNENKSQFFQYQCQQKKPLGVYGLKE